MAKAPPGHLINAASSTGLDSEPGCRPIETVALTEHGFCGR
jgi:hypothetical protein